MITATCRTCHQDWTIETLPPPMPPSTLVKYQPRLEAPCGHGSFRGVLAPGVKSDPGTRRGRLGRR